MKNSFLIVIFLILIILLFNGCEEFKLPVKQNYKLIEEKVLLNEMPVIESYSFGLIVIDGKSYGDVKIYNNKVYSWKYIKHHKVTKNDIKDIIDEVNFFIVGTGDYGKVQVEDEVLTILKEKNIQIIIEKTKEAIDEYNKLVREGKKVSAILHSTC